MKIINIAKLTTGAAIACMLTSCSGDRYTEEVKPSVICKERVEGRFNKQGDVEETPASVRRCSTELRTISSHYVATDGKIYWMKQEKSIEKPCISGSGDASALIYNLSPVCLFSKPGQYDVIEDRSLKLVTHDSPAFQSLEDTSEALPYWKQDQYSHYAKDANHVYYYHTKIEGATPALFTVFFPFGTDDNWRNYEFSKNDGEVFVGGKSIGKIDMNHFTPLKPVSCPEHGLKTCTYVPDMDSFFTAGNWGSGILGKAGSDLIFLREHGADYFQGMASPDMFMFATTKKIYVYTHETFYELAAGTLSSTRVLVPMDVDYYENNK
ncbi:hypothetical protein A249_04255 [Pseudomonas syringae pv. actinidiae ICMP 18804]|uniref:Uncharacterized protein n=2 Tax=Pseudomonas syringae TaxID=317 RepID=A0A3M4KJ83_PSESF|nr:hypothetical protein A249_04255 [Pseudomonas syringae pv. actinidiae ICMP 18804]RMQ29175.1 hypothetical protein ALQ07_100810 [Pseudomonas syringae pv. actinidiae]